jgi:hypothetical protein
VTRSVVEPRKRKTAPGVSRRVFVGALVGSLVLYALLLGLTLVAAQNIVDDATDGLCLLVEDTPDNVTLAHKIRERYDCPEYKAGNRLDVPSTGAPSPTSTSAPTMAPTKIAPPRSSVRPGVTPTPQPGTRTRTATATPTKDVKPKSARTRTVTETHTNTKVTTPTPRPSAPAAPVTTSPGLLGSLCTLVGIKVPCSRLGLN